MCKTARNICFVDNCNIFYKLQSNKSHTRDLWVWFDKNSDIHRPLLEQMNRNVTSLNSLHHTIVVEGESANLRLFDKQNMIHEAFHKYIKVAFLPDSLGQAIMMKNILDVSDNRLKGIFYFHKYVNKSDLQIIQKRLQINIKRLTLKAINAYNPNMILTCNDWNPANKIHILLHKILGIKTVCLQESIIDFYKNKKMQYADYVLLQGVDSIKYFKNRKIVFLTGNPRYIYKNNVEGKKGPIMINYNLFFHELRNDGPKWLKDVVSLCESLNLEYFISKHPKAILPIDISPDKLIHSNALSINKQFSDCSFLITRFTSLIHEALLLGKNVIYYDPFDEEELIGYDFKDKHYTGLPLIRAKDKQTLKKVISDFYNKRPLEDKELIHHYLTAQTGSVDGLAAKRCFLALLQIAKLPITTRKLPSLFLNVGLNPARKLKHFLLRYR